MGQDALFRDADVVPVDADGLGEWAVEALAWRGIVASRPPELVRSWGISTVLSIPTARGLWFAKAVPPLFAGEAPLTAWLAARFPGAVPEVAAVDRRRCWLLVAQAGDIVLEEGTFEDGVRAVRLLARIQHRAAPSVDALQALGLPNRRLSGLLDVFEREELAGIRDLRVPVGVSVAALVGTPIPDSLVHGDFQARNVGVGDGRHPIIFDWADGSISHPFVDLAPLLDRDAPDAETADALRDAFLDEWAHLLALPLHVVRGVWDLVSVVSPLFHIDGYLRILDAVPHEERSGPLRTAFTQWVGRLRTAVGE